MSILTIDEANLKIEKYLKLVDLGEIDTVVCATPDPYGRLVGKRLTAQAFEALCLEGDGVNVSSHILATDVELESIDLPVSNSSNGWADFRLVPDYSTFRRTPWESKTALVLCDVYHSDSDEMVRFAPRSILRHQLQRARKVGLTVKCASELEFYLSTESHKDAWASEYKGLSMMSSYRSDYQILQSGRDEWFIRQIREYMPQFGISVESSKPEYGLGQQEITLDYCEALKMADNHVLFKHGVKELAHRAELTPTFMAKPYIDDVGSSCHLHISIWDADKNTPLSWGPDGMSEIFGSFVAGQIEHATDLGLLFAPTINSYKRFQPNQFAGTTITVGRDNRSCGFRLVGQGHSFRVENRIPGADVNPYYAYSAMILAGLEGIELNLPTPTVFDGNAWETDGIELMPTSMHRSLDRFEQSEVARKSLGDDVFNHLFLSAKHELVTFDSSVVTDWETKRYYERV